MSPVSVDRIWRNGSPKMEPYGFVDDGLDDFYVRYVVREIEQALNRGVIRTSSEAPYRAVVMVNGRAAMALRDRFPGATVRFPDNEQYQMLVDGKRMTDVAETFVGKAESTRKKNAATCRRELFQTG